MDVDTGYSHLLGRIIEEGQDHDNRTSQPTRRVWGARITHDLSRSFPVITTKKVAYKVGFAEMLGFMRGETDIRWYQQHGCNIWNDDHARWHGPDLEADKQDLNNSYLFPEDRDKLIQSISYRENNPHSLGHIYGATWHDLGGHNQIAEVLYALKERSNSRRLIISAWDPANFHMMALPPCHVTYHFAIDGDRLNIAMWQRSVDVPLGLPFNLLNTGLFCHAMANATDLKPGLMSWYGDDCHIYANQIEVAKEQLTREPVEELPQLRIKYPRDPWFLEPQALELTNYCPHPAIKYPLTVS